MGQALYRKYRPKSLAEIVGQEHITDTLTKAVSSGRISHAYLFSGPRGVGKTSIARIMAHEINGLPYTDDSAHLDIIEIDAASNRRIDEIRELRDKVYIAPTSGKYKVYIIDEVHMLTREAFNALLKTLEEPPAHAVFILATTEAHKLPETIVSRTQHYTFKPVEQRKVIEHLRHIATEEKVAIDDDALALLALYGEGSFRDSISVLDQAQSISSLGGRQIGADHVRQLLGIAPAEAIDQLIAALSQQALPGTLLNQINDLYGQGLQAASIASQLADTLRSSLVRGKPLLPVGQTLSLLKQLIEVPASRNPERLFEIILIESIQPEQGMSAPMQPAVAVQPVVVIATPAPKPAAPVSPAIAPKPTATPAAKPTAPAPAPAPITATPPAPPAAPAATEEKLAPSTVTGPDVVVALDATVWPEVLSSIKKEYNTLYGVLRMANPIFTPDSIELQFKFAFHQKRLNEVKNKQIIANYIKQITGSDVNVICTYHKDAAAGAVAEGTTATTPAPALETISNIFGGAEVL